MLRNDGNSELMVVSAARFVTMYRCGNTGAPAAAETYKNDGTEEDDASLASRIAVRKYDQ